MSTSPPQTPTRRVLVLEHLGQDPDRTLTCVDLARVVGGNSGALIKLLRSMEQHAQVVSVTEWRPHVGRPASLWRIAPPGTVPPPLVALPPEQLAARRRRDREYQRARRARFREECSPMPPALALPPGAACVGADPDLFFPGTPETEAKALAICAQCPIRAKCYTAARATHQEFGVWGGVNFERPAESEMAR